MLVSGRSLGLFFVACALAAEYMGGLGTIGVSETAFHHGMGVIWYHVSASAGILVFGLFFAHYYRKYGIQTIPEYLYYLFDIKTWKVNALLNFIAYTFFTVIEVVALGSILAGLTGFPIDICSVVAAILLTLLCPGSRNVVHRLREHVLHGLDLRRLAARILLRPAILRPGARRLGRCQWFHRLGSCHEPPGLRSGLLLQPGEPISHGGPRVLHRRDPGGSGGPGDGQLCLWGTKLEDRPAGSHHGGVPHPSLVDLDRERWLCLPRPPG